MRSLFTNYSGPTTLCAILQRMALELHSRFQSNFWQKAKFFLELRQVASLMVGENAHINAPQSGARRHKFAAGARPDVVSPSRSPTRINTHGARKRGCDEKVDPRARPPRGYSVINSPNPQPPRPPEQSFTHLTLTKTPKAK